MIDEINVQAYFNKNVPIKSSDGQATSNMIK